MTDEQLALPKGVDSVADLGTTYTLAAAAVMLGVSAKTVQRMVKRGDLPGSHKAPMPNGKGEHWRVPLSALYEYQNKQQATAPPPDATQTELTALRDKVTQLETELTAAREWQAIAVERGQQLEQLHLTFRTALNAGDRPRRRWKRKTKQN